MKKLMALLLLALIAVSPAFAQGRDATQDNCASDDPTVSTETRISEPIDVDVYLEIPEFVAAGLANGSMERVGGVIRYSADQQILAWLRQGGQAGQAVESSASLLERIVSKHSAIGLALGRAVPILNIAMAGFGLFEQIVGIRAHEAELERIYDRVSEEFQRDRRVELLAALDNAENSLLVNSCEYKLEVLALVNSDLAVAREQLSEDLTMLLGGEMSPENVELVVNYQVLAMKVCTLETRLRLEIGENEAARDRLSKCVDAHRTYAQKFVRKWLGNSPALYFHESVSDEYFYRYLDIERWLQGKRNVLANLISEHRRNFWNIEALQPLDAPPIGFQIDENPFYLQAIPSAEILIENFQRLLGYKLELESMLLPFSEWDTYEEARIASHDDYVLLVKKPPPRNPTEP